MDRSEFMFRYIEECMYPLCLEIILRENYNLRDDSKVYESIVCQFQQVMDKFVEKENNKREEEQEELLANVRQNILKRIAKDVNELFKDADAAELGKRMMKEKLDDDFFLRLTRELREKEETGGK